MVEVISDDDIEVAGSTILAEEAMALGVPNEGKGEEFVEEVLADLRSTALPGHSDRIREMESRLKRLFAEVKF